VAGALCGVMFYVALGAGMAGNLHELAGVSSGKLENINFTE
jgi:hypothetical protein